MSWIDKLTNPLAERVRSPLYSTFIISWLICNWKIPLTIVMPSYAKIGDDNLANYIFHNYLNIYEGAIFPLLMSILYIFFIPFIDLQIVEYTEKRKREKIDKKIKVGRLHNVQGSVFYDLKLQFIKEQEDSIKMHEENIKLKTDINDFKKEIETLKNDKTAALSERDTISAKLDSISTKYNNLDNRGMINDLFKGRWKLYYKDMRATDNRNMDSENFEIRNNEDYFIINNDGTDKLAFKLRLIDFDVDRKKLSFVKAEPEAGGRPLTYNVLNIISNDRFEGFENGLVKVLYERQKFKREKEESN